jgi:hypothetical protein
MNFKEWFLTEVSFKTIHDLATKANLDIFPFDKEELIKGYETESEHAGKMGKDTDVIGKDKSKILKIAIAHLREDPHYYKKLVKAGI